MALLRGGEELRAEAELEWSENVARARERLEQAAWDLPFPAGVEAIGVELEIGGGGASVADRVEVAYVGPEPLASQVIEVLSEALRRALGHPGLQVSFRRAAPAMLALTPPDTAGLGEVIAALRHYPGVRAEIRSAAADSVMSDMVREALQAAGTDTIDVGRLPEPGPVEVRLRRTGG
jgi:hypothetical protein